MCLNSITREFEPADENIRRAWKMVDIHHDGSLWPPYQGERPYTAEWQTATGYSIELPSDYTIDEQRDHYMSGFHVFVNLEDAKWVYDYLGRHGRRRKIVPVEVRGIMYEGIDATDSCQEYIDRAIQTLVAREIRLV